MFPMDLTQLAYDNAKRVDPEHYLETLSDLIRIPCISGEEAEIAQWVSNRLRKIGIESAHVDEFNNVVAHVPGGSRRLLICAYLDPATPPVRMEKPFVPVIKEIDGEQRVFGSGAASTKGGIASILEALTALMASGEEIPTITFLGVACDLHPKFHRIHDAFRLHQFEADGAILAGDPTNLQIGIGARGFAHIEVNFIGQPHHAGVPDHSRNPIVGVAAFVQHALTETLPEHPVLGSASLAAIEMRADTQRPNTPSNASVLLDRRLILDESPLEEIIKQYRDWASSCSNNLGVEVVLKRHQYQWLADYNHSVVKSVEESYRLIVGRDPTFYSLPYSSCGGTVQNVGKIMPVAFSAGDIWKLGSPQEYAVLSNNVIAARVLVASIVLFAAT